MATGTVEVPVSIRPSIEDRFPVVAAREAIRALLHEKLVVSKADKVIAELSKELVEGVKAKLKDLAGPNSRYKLFSHVVVGESTALPGAAAGAEQQPPRGAGMHIATRCMWDPAVDDMISESITTDALIAVVTAYAVYAY